MPRILIVEDEDIIRSAVRKLLQHAGYEVADAVSVEEAESHDPDSFDLVITDLVMQRQDGPQTVQELQSEFPGFKFIALSGENVDTLPQARQLGAQHTFVKPFATEELLETIEEELIVA